MPRAYNFGIRDDIHVHDLDIVVFVVGQLVQFGKVRRDVIVFVERLPYKILQPRSYISFIYITAQVRRFVRDSSLC